MAVAASEVGARSARAVCQSSPRGFLLGAVLVLSHNL